MTYTPDGKFSPGSLLGDAKSMNMRTVPYQVNPDGTLVHKSLGKGSVVYIDEHGYAVPYDRSSGKEQNVVTPYGVVWKMTMVDQNAPKYATNAPLVTIVTNGVIGVEYKEKMGWSLPPVLGQPVNEYGCLAAGVDKGEHIIGICDGVGTDPEDPNKKVIAVRLTPNGTELTEGSDPYTNYVEVCNQQTRKTGVNDDDDGTIPAYAPVRRVMTSNPEGVPSVKRWTSEAQDFYGYAAEPIPPGGTGKVVVGGLIDLPYVLPNTVNDTDALSRGYRDVWVLDYTETGEPWYKKITTFVKDAMLVVGDVCNTLLLVSNTKKAWNEACRVKGDKPKVEHGKLSLTSSNEEPVIDGWLTVDVNPVTIHAPTSLDYAVSARTDPETALIPGHVYGGSNSGVREYQTNWDGLPFFGVCTALPPKGNTTPFMREGAVDVVAADDWDAGDYIDYTRHSIPEAYEPFMPHIGVAQADTKKGELGAVHLTPWDPNTYAVYDHVSTSAGAPPLGVMVYIHPAGRVLHQFPEDYDGKSTDEIAGILRGYVTSSDANPVPYRTVIVQTGGYAVVPVEEQSRQFSNAIVTYLSDARKEGDRTTLGFIVWYIHPLGARNQLGRIVATYTDAEATENTVVVKLDIQNLYRPDTPALEATAVFGVPAWMQYNKILHFGWYRPQGLLSTFVLWRNSDTDVITTGWDPAYSELVKDANSLRLYLMRPDGTAIPATKEDEGCCMSPAAHTFFQSTRHNILKNDFEYTPGNPNEAHFVLNSFTESQLRQLVEGEMYTYYFGLSFDGKNALTTGYVTLVYDGEYKEEPEEPDLAARRVRMTPVHTDEEPQDNIRHELKEDQGETSPIIDPSEP